MKKIFGIALVLAVVASLCFGSIALAADPTKTDVTWDGGGGVGIDVNSGDAETNFSTSGYYIKGSFTATDFNDNPYSYGVDTFSTYANAEVSGSGYISHYTERLTSEYRPAGTNSWNYLEVCGGWGAMVSTSKINFNQQEDSLYGYRPGDGRPGWTPNNHHIEAIADWYYMDRGVMNSEGEYANVWAQGSGSAWLNCMGSRIYATSARLGWGDGCYTNAQFHAVGSGTFTVYALGSNQIRTPIADQYGALAPGGWVIPGNGTYGSCSYSVIANFAGTFDVGNYSVDVQ